VEDESEKHFALSSNAGGFVCGRGVNTTIKKKAEPKWLCFLIIKLTKTTILNHPSSQQSNHS